MTNILKLTAQIYTVLFIFSACVATVPAVKQEVKPKPKIGVMSLDGAIESETVDDWNRELEGLSNQNDIVIIKINSMGGEVEAGFKFIQKMETTPAIKVCVVDRYAMSMAFVILEACDHKIMTRRSMLMFHKPYIPGQTELSRDQKEFLRVLIINLVIETSRTMKVSGPYIREKINQGDWFMDWQEALDIGAVDRIVWRVQEVLDNPILGDSDWAVSSP